MPISPEEHARLVPEAVANVPFTRAVGQDGEPQVVPVRPPRPRNLARQLLEGDGLKADARRFISRRRGALPPDWDVEGIVAAEQALEAVDIPLGSYLGLLRFAADLQADRNIGRTWAERRWWGHLRRRLASSSGIVLGRSVADGMEMVRYLVEDADAVSQQGFTDLLRVLGARTGIDVIDQPRLAEKPLWDFSILLGSRARLWNRTHPSSARRVLPLDFYLGGVMVYLRDRQTEPSLVDLRIHVFQTGAPLAPALDSWLRKFQDCAGSSLLLVQPPSQTDPRTWVWDSGKSLVLDDLPDRQARLAACERGLIDIARREEAAREATAVAVDRLVRELLRRELPLSRLAGPIPPEPPPAAAAPRTTRIPATPIARRESDIFDLATLDSSRPADPPTVRLPPRPPAAPVPPRITPGRTRPASPVPAAETPPVPLLVVPVPTGTGASASDPLAMAMQEYETSANMKVITLSGGMSDAHAAMVVTTDLQSLDALPVGFDLPDLERQAVQLEECLRTGLTPSGRQWIEKYRGLLSDSRVREFLRFPADWIGGLRDLLASGDPWILAGMDDLVRYLYPAAHRPLEIDFRYNQRLGDPSPARTGWDWVVLRLIALAVAETASGQGDPAFAPTPLVTVRRWHSYSRARDLAAHTPGWWSWLAEEVEARSESMHQHSFQVRAAAELSLWRERYVKPWLAIPSDSSIAALGPWARMPLHHLRQDPAPSAERWANRLSMLGQLLEESKEDILKELAIGPI